MNKDNVKCPVCGEAGQLKFSGHPGYQSSKQFDIYHCLDCYSAYASPLKVDVSVYDHIYRNISEIPGYDRYLRYADQVLLERNPLEYLAAEEDIYWSIREYLRDKNPNKLKILEVGCGFGYLTYALSKAGFDVLGIDISQVAIENAQKRYGSFYQCVDLKVFSERAEKYDLVIFTEVIEHIENVQEFLRSAYEVLKAQGAILCTTPNRSPYPEDILWETEPPPVHLHWFSEKSIEVLAKRLGVKASFIDFTGFNVMEIKKTKSFHQPDIRIRNFCPSRQSRLDELGNPIKEILVVTQEPLPCPVNPPVWKVVIKSVLAKLGLLKPIILVKSKWKRYQTNRRETRLKMQMIRYVSLNPLKRPTLCAILEKGVR